MKDTAKKLLISYFWITIGSAIYALGFDWCYAPNAIGFGGITGLAQIINAVLPWAPIGTVVIVLNVPLFILGWRLLGGHLLLSSLYAMFISSVFVDIFAAVIPFQPMDPMLATIFGGILVGLSLGIILLQGATTGVTFLHGEGAWSGESKKVMLCAFKQKQIVPLRRMVKEIDPEAFLIVCDAHEVLGDGFRSYQQNDL